MYVKHYLEKMLKDGMKKFKDSKLLRLDHIFFQFEEIGLYPPIYQQIAVFKKMH